MHSPTLKQRFHRRRISPSNEFVASGEAALEGPSASEEFESNGIRQRTGKSSNSFLGNSDDSTTSETHSIDSLSNGSGYAESRVPISHSKNSVDSSILKNLRRFNDLVWCMIPPKLYKWCCYGTYLFWFIMGILILRKTHNATAAVRYVKQHGHTVSEEAIASSPAFRELLWSLDHEFQKPPAIFLLNQYALNMTFNFLCNTQDMDGVHERLVFTWLPEN